MKRKQRKSLPWRWFGHRVLISIKFCELLLRISPKIMNGLRSHIKNSKECFIRYPNTLRSIKKSRRLRLVFSTHFSVFGYPDETLSHTCCMAFVSTFGHFFFLVIYWLSEFVFPATSSEILLAVLKRPSHVKLNVGQLVLANSNWCVWTTQQHVGKLLATNRTGLYSRQLFANMLLCRSHTLIWVCQHELANTK